MQDTQKTNPESINSSTLQKVPGRVGSLKVGQRIATYPAPAIPSTTSPAKVEG